MKKLLAFLGVALMLFAAGCDYDSTRPDTKKNRKMFENMTGINEQLHAIDFHKGGGAQAMVPRVAGIAHVAGASHNGDTLRCASS